MWKKKKALHHLPSRRKSWKLSKSSFLCCFFAGPIKRASYNNTISHLLLRTLAPKISISRWREEQLDTKFWMNSLSLSERILNESLLGFGGGGLGAGGGFEVYLWNNKTYGLLSETLFSLGFSHVHHESFRSLDFICFSCFFPIHLKDT